MLRCLNLQGAAFSNSRYGSMNLLSRDDVEDNIMRLESRKVAQELLGMALT